MRRSLLPHPDTPSAAVRGIQVEVERQASGAVGLTYALAGSTDELLVPLPAEGTRTDGLWQHTCFEAFIRPDGGDAYWEFNFAPSTEWAAYRLSGYRSGMGNAALPRPPRIETQVSADRLVVKVELQTSLPADVAWRVGLSAVIEGRSGERHFWALAHPPGEPDFHSPDCFALELAPPPAP